MAAGRRTDRRDEAGSRDGLRSANSNLGKAESHTNHPTSSHSFTPLSLPGIPTDLWLPWRSFLATVLSFPASALTAGRGFIDLFFYFFLFFVLNIAGHKDGGFALF